MNWNKIKLVSWDVDGTLYPMRSLYFQLARQLYIEALHGRFFAARGELMQIKEFHKKLSQKTNTNCRDVFSDLNRDSILVLERKWFYQALKNIKPSVEVTRTLSALKEKNICQVVLSNYEADYKIAALGLHFYFQKLWSCEYMHELKPSAHPFKVLQEYHKVQPSEHLHIGDREDKDGIGARLSGCFYLDIKDIQNLKIGN